MPRQEADASSVARGRLRQAGMELHICSWGVNGGAVGTKQRTLATDLQQRCLGEGTPGLRRRVSPHAIDRAAEQAARNNALSVSIRTRTHSVSLFRYPVCSVIVEQLSRDALPRHMRRQQLAVSK